MDEIGVHSRMNAKKPIVPGKGTTSPVQTVAGKDLSNPASLTPRQNSELNQNLDNIDHVSETSLENEFLESNYAQDAQDPNANDDSGMSFDSVALHNLST
ncbi:hypothetical protein RND71_026775 [Anisodus tanguticus]|uniref:Uncharacterized protein n=1 Tax=Anisodus tanguticus TaxID=243964 RepID=A0AAE1VBL4_9SOLA|nr:hypothetical protein RND71_026774 [Anisodus tanguticus]KAK4354581.1 hypothetical protein RND71_026775 [Anisodus tanguticus]